MDDLLNQKCVPCEGGTPPLSPSEVERYKKQLKQEWQIVDNKKLQRTFIFKNFRESMNFVNKVANIAESEGHHPDIYIFYSKVKIELWTHAIGGLFTNDFIMAAKIELLIGNLS